MSCSFLFGYFYPVCINPATIAFGIRFYGDKAELGTNPLALAHGEGIPCLGETFAISGIGKAHSCSVLRTAIGIAAAEIADRKAQVDILMDTWLVVDLG